jgi:hypothetical protein
MMKSWLTRVVVAASWTMLGASVSPAWGVPLLQEVLYDAVGPDAEGVFTELYGDAGFDFAGWSLVGINGSDGGAYRTVDLTGAIIPADGILVVATSRANAELLAQRDFIGSVDWQNGPDAVQLLDPDGNIVDALQYGDAGIHNAGMGMAAPDVAAGQSLARDFLSTDTRNNLADFSVFDSPTPGEIPGSGTDPIPEPGTIFLVGLGLAGASGLGRRIRSRCP